MGHQSHKSCAMRPLDNCIPPFIFCLIIDARFAYVISVFLKLRLIAASRARRFARAPPPNVCIARGAVALCARLTSLHTHVDGRYASHQDYMEYAVCVCVSAHCYKVAHPLQAQSAVSILSHARDNRYRLSIVLFTPRDEAW